MGLIVLVFGALLIGGLFILISKQLIKIKSAKNKSVSSVISKMTATGNDNNTSAINNNISVLQGESIVS